MNDILKKRIEEAAGKRSFKYLLEKPRDFDPFGQKGQSYCSQRGQSCLAKRVKVAWLFQLLKPQRREEKRRRCMVSQGKALPRLL